MRNHSKFWVLRMCFTFSLILICLLVAIIFTRTLIFGQRLEVIESCDPIEAPFIQDEAMISRFQQALRIQTVARAPHDYNAEDMVKFVEFIKQAFPIIHSSKLVQFEHVANYSVIYTIQGSQPQLKAVMFSAHMDVVPIANPSKWDVPPFEGVVKDGYIYGRGTMDNKQSLMALLESMEELLKNNYKPQRTVILAFGHDEEVGGVEGATAINKLLLSRNVQVEFILDEGLAVTKEILVGIKKPVAMVGVTEKGYLTLRLHTNYTGGHSSMPTMTSSITILNNAVLKLHPNSHPSMFGYGPEKQLLEDIAPKADVPFRVVFSNLWLFGPLVSWAMSRKPSGNAMVRTTTAVTEFHAGIKVNVLPPTAWATVNQRVHPAQTIEEVIEYDRQLINDDRVKIEVREVTKPAPISPSSSDSFGYQTVSRSIRQVFQDAVVAPGTMIANTDSRRYWDLTKNIYRFCPTIMFPSDLARFHGVNERISIENYKQVVHFYYHMLKNADRASLPPVHSHGSEL